MPRVTLRIPEGLAFGALRLAREEDGSVSVDTAVVTQIAQASGLDPQLFTAGPEDNLASLIVQWYAAHLAAGGDPDPVAEAIGAEVRAEDGHRGLQ